MPRFPAGWYRWLGTIGACALLCGPAVGRAAGQERGTYDACALRLEGRMLVAGRAGQRVARLPIVGRPSLTEAFAASDSALAHARHFEDAYATSTYLAVGGTLLLASSGAVLSSHGGLAIGLAGGGLVAWIVGSRKQESALRSLARAVWWYNRDLPR